MQQAMKKAVCKKEEIKMQEQNKTIEQLLTEIILQKKA